MRHNIPLPSIAPVPKGNSKRRPCDIHKIELEQMHLKLNNNHAIQCNGQNARESGNRIRNPEAMTRIPEERATYRYIPTQPWHRSMMM